MALKQEEDVYIKAAKEIVYGYMTIGDIEYECDKRNIKGESRSVLEQKLIKALAEEYKVKKPTLYEG